MYSATIVKIVDNNVNCKIKTNGQKRTESKHNTVTELNQTEFAWLSFWK